MAPLVRFAETICVVAFEDKVNPVLVAELAIKGTWILWI